jgi:hypothetical protein
MSASYAMRHGVRSGPVGAALRPSREPEGDQLVHAREGCDKHREERDAGDRGTSEIHHVAMLAAADDARMSVR